jgi:ferredoxin-NADP reductase
MNELHLQVKQLRWEAEGVLSLLLTHPEGKPLPEWSPGAHIEVVLRDGLIRQYSLCGDRAEDSAYRIAVLREVDGRGGSSFVHGSLRPGQIVGVRGPHNKFELTGSPSYLFIAGGIGITPILPMLSEVAPTGADWTLVYGGRNRSSMAFVDELARYGSRVRLVPENTDGRLDLDELLGEPREGTLVYCCGPPGLIAAVEERCRSWPPESLRVERFTLGTTPAAAPTDGGSGFEVICRRSGLTLRVPPGRSILETVEAAGIAKDSSCREGICGTCETGVLDGEPDHRDYLLSEAERASGKTMMICVSRSRSERLVLDI